MTRLHELFDDLAREAKHYDVIERAVAISRRRRRRRRLLAVTGAAVAVSVVIGLTLTRPAPAPPLDDTDPPPTGRLPVACSMHPLPLPAGYATASVTGGDPAGRFVVGYAHPDTAVMWRDGELQPMPQPPGRQAAFTDVNSRGIAVGNSLVELDGVNVSQAWVYRGGTFTPLSGDKTTALAISDRNVIVGEREGRPVVWSDPDAMPRDLPMHPGAEFGPASDIDDDGTAIGTLSPVIAHLWAPDGTLRPLPGAAVVTSIRNGWVAGTADHAGVRWNAQTGAMQRLAGDLTGLQAKVNAQGWVAGSTADRRLRIADTGHYVDLPGEGGIVARLSDDGLTVAGSVGDEGSEVPVVWRCRMA